MDFVCHTLWVNSLFGFRGKLARCHSLQPNRLQSIG